MNEMNETAFLDAEEEALIESLEKDVWESAADLEGRKTRLPWAAGGAPAKDCRVDIRITRNDLDGIKRKAAEEGVPCQALAASIIHKYVTGRLSETRRPLTE